jgi:hypothetical protein
MNRGFGLNCLDSLFSIIVIGIGLGFAAVFMRFFADLVKIDKYSTLFFVLLAVSIWFIKGNPIVNNYYGIYKSYEIELGGDVIQEEYDKIIVPKSIAERTINEIENNCEEECDVNKRGYVFIDAGVFNGFSRLDSDVSFFKCLRFALLERLIHTLMYFLLPFIIGILIIEKYEKKKHN